MAPVNPEGQTARDLTDEEIANGEQWIAALTTGPVRYPEMKIDCSLLARLLAEVKRRRAVRPSEEQTAEDVRRPAHPQAPAEPWRSPGSSGERLTLHELLSRAAEGYRQLGGDLRAAAEHFREHPPEAATEELETAEARLSTARGQAEAFAKTAREARAKVAERDERIATLTERAEGALALAETYRKAWRAALGAPEENT